MKTKLESLFTKYNPKLLFIPENIKNIGKNKFFYIRTYGCQSNVRDSETISGIMETLKYTKTDNINDADFIILNTCAIRERAETKVFGELGLMQKLRKEKPNLTIAVCGCMMQEPHIVKKLQESYWNINIIFGTNSIHKLPSLIEENMYTQYLTIDTKLDKKLVAEDLPSIRNSKIKAFVNVMYGCSNFCTFCIVPFTRGKERSRKLNKIIEEVNLLKKQGYKEITLLGQNVNNYGLDLNPKLSFVELLTEVSKTGIERIRFTTSNPWNFNHDIIDVVQKNENIMPYFHLPIQSGNNEILDKMNRSMIIEEYKSLIDEIRNKVPNVAISTDIIVGFPNETEKEFQDTLSLYNYVKYDNAYTFIYSKRKNTPAANWNDNIDINTKKERLQRLNLLVKKYSKENNEKFVGKTLKVLVEGYSKNNKKRLFGYTENQKLVNFDGDINLISKIVDVNIIEARRFNLEGKHISHGSK